MTDRRFGDFPHRLPAPGSLREAAAQRKKRIRRPSLARTAQLAPIARAAGGLRTSPPPHILADLCDGRAALRAKIAGELCKSGVPSSMMFERCSVSWVLRSMEANGGRRRRSGSCRMGYSTSSNSRCECTLLYSSSSACAGSHAASTRRWSLLRGLQVRDRPCRARRGRRDVRRARRRHVAQWPPPYLTPSAAYRPPPRLQE